MITVTKHGEKRIRERSGLNKSSVNRIVEKAYKDGLKMEETTGELHKWIIYVHLKNQGANEIRIYGDKAYIFSDGYLITLLQVPNQLLKNIQANKKRKDCYYQGIA